jgi:hypothetical protein
MTKQEQILNKIKEKENQLQEIHRIPDRRMHGKLMSRQGLSPIKEKQQQPQTIKRLQLRSELLRKHINNLKQNLQKLKKESKKNIVIIDLSSQSQQQQNISHTYQKMTSDEKNKFARQKRLEKMKKDNQEKEKEKEKPKNKKTQKKQDKTKKEDKQKETKKEDKQKETKKKQKKM